MLTVPTGMPLLKIDPAPDVYAILLSSISSIKLSFTYLISPELFPLPITIAWTLPGVIEIGTLEFKSYNNNIREDL